MGLKREKTSNAQRATRNNANKFGSEVQLLLTTTYTPRHDWSDRVCFGLVWFERVWCGKLHSISMSVIDLLSGICYSSFRNFFIYL